MSELPAISLFSGVGGLDLGVERAGYRVRVAVELDAAAAASLRENFPHMAVLEDDITKLTGKDILTAGGLGRGDAELLVGGPPCKPFSKSGNWLAYKREGRDPGASLLDDYVRVLEAVRPRAFILENVYGLAYKNHNAAWLDYLLTACKRLKYKVTARVLLAADYGVPQRRQRLFLIGSRDSVPSFPSPTHSGPHETRRNFDRSLSRHIPTRNAIGDLEHRDDLFEPEEIVNGRYGHLLPEIPPGSNYLFFTEKRGHPKPLFGWRQRYWSFLLKLHPDEPSPTIQAQPGPYVGPFHWSNRRLRLPEIKRLQTFPDEFVVLGSRRSAQMQIGNAVPPLLAERIAAVLRGA